MSKRAVRLVLAALFLFGKVREIKKGINYE